MQIGAAYIRVSTTDQTEYSPESQVRLILDYAAKNDIIIPEKYIFKDEGISGRNTTKRTSFKEMISKAKLKEFEVILVYSTSRFARNLEDSIVYKSMLQREYGIDVISITQPSVDKKTDMLTNAIYAVMDEWYSLDLSDNVKRGMTQKALSGETQTAPPFGYDLLHKGDAFTINEEEAKAIKYIFEEFVNGKSAWYIARSLNNMGIKTKRGCKISTRNIDYILRNVSYKGYSRWTPNGRVHWDFKNPDTMIVKAKHEAIISDALFDSAQKRLDELEAIHHNKQRPQETQKHWLSGIIKCSQCGSTLNYNSSTPKRKNPCFRCGGYQKGFCKNMNFLLVSQAEKLLIDYLHNIFNNIDILYNANIQRLNNSINEINLINEEVKNLDKKLIRARDAFLNGVFSLNEFSSLKLNIENEKSDLTGRIKYLNSSRSYEGIYKKIQNVYSILIDAKFSKNEKCSAVKKIIDSIIFDKKTGLFQINFYD